MYTSTVSTNSSSTKAFDSNDAEKANFPQPEVIDEETCIDDKLGKELDSGEKLKKVIINADVKFCNGVRIRVKSVKFESNKYKAYGYVQSNSGHDSCLRETKDFKHSLFLGDQGTLEGDTIKIALGGHDYDKDGKLTLSEHSIDKYVKFAWDNYTGELAIYEKGKLRCWAIH